MSRPSLTISTCSTCSTSHSVLRHMTTIPETVSSYQFYISLCWSDQARVTPWRIVEWIHVIVWSGWLAPIIKNSRNPRPQYFEYWQLGFTFPHKFTSWIMTELIVIEEWGNLDREYFSNLAMWLVSAGALTICWSDCKLDQLDSGSIYYLSSPRIRSSFKTPAWWDLLISEGQPLIGSWQLMEQFN